ncbi:MAG: RpiB/LacA/LacB family sugar-phosphate isomerase [Nanoarchaeota archaeon]|nr:RpiB/LacA/LacB family sugar-phosphate isomerase [Nanoarchaeota archaeon]MBU1622932.1 RpiB/LacA/LacB family sugar-phosphate isomerase [Nanoarchaeota archaeon]MBU1973945.1 RpiB/LacA/LacB family sugar-phosphate isomerase [Nanoarchaeota archaeon]
MVKVYLASDHGGFLLKKKLLVFLAKNNYNLEDLGPKEFNIKDDYPDYALPLAKKVSKDKNSFGILLCRNGQGVCISANKVKGIRAVTGFSKKMIKSTRHDDNANVLCLPADYIKEKEAKKIIKIFLETKFSKLARHQRRLNKIKRLEK